MPIRFDDSLPALVMALTTLLSKEQVERGVAIRDFAGRLAFALPDEIAQTTIARIDKVVRDRLGAYARDDRPIVAANDHGAQDLINSPSALPIRVGEVVIRLIDRRLVGADWLRIPAKMAPPPPRYVFASLKGGVGRSTALSIAASHLAARGKRVLTVDLDLEAPGLGSLLLNHDTLPRYGLIDALVENGLTGIDDNFIADLVGPSDLASRHGRIDVLPAFGRRSVDNPADVLAKISRAYAEDIGSTGKIATFMDQVGELLGRFSDPKQYDAILIDSRAGLHETTATAILGLGAEVLLFGLDEPQTFQGYSVLLAHLSRFANSSDVDIPEWIERINMVQGKAPLDSALRAEFAEKCRQLFVDTGLERKDNRKIATEPPSPASPFSDVPWDDEIADEEVLPLEPRAYREPVVVLSDEKFRGFDPRAKRDLLSESIYLSSFGSFLSVFDNSLPKN